MDEKLRQFGFGLRQLFPVRNWWGGGEASVLSDRQKKESLTVDSQIAERGSTVVLDVGVGTGEERDKNGNGACVDELLPVLICRKERMSMRITGWGGGVGTYHCASC
jgi:hypothetical protein